MQDGRRSRRLPLRLLLKLAGRDTTPRTKPMPPAHEGVLALATESPVDGEWWAETVGAGN